MIPATVPLSKNVDVASAVEEMNLARKPFSPPVTPAPPVIPRDEVATHWVEVPVDQRTWPRVPEALVESRRKPERERLLEKRLVEVSPVVEALESVVCPVTERVPFEDRDEVAVIDPIVADPPVSEEIVAVTAFKSVAKKLELVALVLFKLVIAPCVEKRLVTVPTVVEEVLSTV